MKVHACFPSACRPNEAVHAPLEPVVVTVPVAPAGAMPATRTAPARAAAQAPIAAVAGSPAMPVSDLAAADLAPSDYYRTTAPYVMVTSGLMDTLS